MAWCEANGVHFLFGLAKTDRLIAQIKAELEGAAAQSRRTGKPARRFKDFRWTTRSSWSRHRRVVAKAEWTKDEANPRFVVTSLTRAECKPRYLYEKVYCARGDMENRIKECQLDLYADRTSTATMRANQLRLWFASMAYVLLCALRRIALHHTPFAKATCGTIRLKLLKIGALVRVSVRRIKVAMASACPAAHAWAALPGVSPPPPTRAPRPPDTRRRHAQPTRHHPQGPPRPLRDFRSPVIVQALSRLQTPRRTTSAKKQTSLIANLPDHAKIG